MTMTKHASGGQRTAAARQARWRERIDRAGLRRVTVVVPAERVEELRAIAARMVEDSGEQPPLSE
jgi:hypothetical protein